MKIALCSDLHLEFAPISLENTENADVLILSGDICVANDLLERDSYNIRGEDDRSNRFHTFFQECSQRFPHVIYIMGNHEHYHGDYVRSHSILRDRLAYLRNLHVLDKETFVLDDVTFIGGTLWTDMNKEDPMTLYSMTGMMNDFRIVRNSNRTRLNGSKEEPAIFSPQDAVDDHKQMMEYIRVVTEGKFDQKFVVCGHHSPSRSSTHPRYKDELLMNGGYSSDLSEFILNNPQIKLWTHGHTHEEFDYMVGSTRIVCNPRGYLHYEERADHFKLKFFEV